MRAVRSVAAALTGALTVLLAAPAAGVDEPDHVPWTEVLPPLPAQYRQTGETLCVDGHARCVDHAVREMRRRLQQLAVRCDHDAVFALYYLRTTEEFRRAATGDDLFDDPAFMNHWATVFADYYFRAYDAWHDWGTPDHVPPAWRIAFEAAEDRAVSGSGNALLGVSAHINRDLPFVLAGIGQTAPDGSSRKPEHDRVNEFLRRVVEPAREEAAERFDPTMDSDSFADTSLVDTTLFQTIVAWREEAWRNAELLTAAPTTLARVLVAERIEADAAVKAKLIKHEAAYRDPAEADERDAYCADNWRG